MSTFVNTGLESIGNRFKEIDIILKEAELHFEKNEELYNALCRSAQVLLIAHFEGYLKELVKNALDDINYYSSFKLSKGRLKRTLCENFIQGQDGKYPEHKIKELTEVFDSLDTKFKKEYFLYETNKNPKTSVLNNIAARFGVENFFNQLKKSKLDLIFSNTNVENEALSAELRELIKKATNAYPYEIYLTFFAIDDCVKGSDNFWSDFMDKILFRRHGIAHGTEIENSAYHRDIEADKVKIEILIYAFTAFICIETNPIT